MHEPTLKTYPIGGDGQMGSASSKRDDNSQGVVKAPGRAWVDGQPVRDHGAPASEVTTREREA